MRHGRAPSVKNMNTRPCGRTDDHMHMEFDSSLKFKDLKTAFVKSDLEVEPFVGKVWDIASGCVKNIGQAGESEMWLDYSDALRTRHLAVLVLQAEGGFELKFRGGSRPGLMADVLLMALALAAFWLMGKVFVPHPPAICIAGIVACVAAALGLVLHCGKAFGAEQSDFLTNKILEQI